MAAEISKCIEPSPKPAPAPPLPPPALAATPPPAPVLLLLLLLLFALILLRLLLLLLPWLLCKLCLLWWGLSPAGLDFEVDCGEPAVAGLAGSAPLYSVPGSCATLPMYMRVPVLRDEADFFSVSRSPASSGSIWGAASASCLRRLRAPPPGLE